MFTIDFDMSKGFRNDYQPDILEEDIDDKENGFATGLLPKKSYQNRICYYKPNENLHQEKFVFHLLLLFTHM